MEQEGETRAKSDPRAKALIGRSASKVWAGRSRLVNKELSGALGGTLCTQARLSWRRRASALQGKTSRVGPGRPIPFTMRGHWAVSLWQPVGHPGTAGEVVATARGGYAILGTRGWAGS